MKSPSLLRINQAKLLAPLLAKLDEQAQQFEEVWKAGGADGILEFSIEASSNRRMKLRSRAFFALGWVLLGLIAGTAVARAEVLATPRSVAEEVLSETVPTAFDPDTFEVADFALDWTGTALANVEATLVPNTLEWVRASEVLLAPRARLRVRVPALGVLGGTVETGRFFQPMVLDEASNRYVVEIPVALLSSARNPIRIRLKQDGGERSGTLQVRFQPRQHLIARKRVYVDASCSPFQVSTDSVGASDREWLFIGCRLVYAKGEEHAVPSLELFALWEGVGDQIEIGRTKVDAVAENLWLVRARSEPGQVAMQAGSHQVVVRYRVPKRLRLLSIAAGIGPYDYDYRAPGKEYSGIVPLLTIYGSYFVTEQIRIVAFDATPIATQTYTDFGLYFHAEQFRSLDRRLSLSLMLGAHVLALGTADGVQAIFSAPQGIEFMFRDFGKPGWNISAGSFLYPLIQGRSYYNAWIRYGARGYFGELNFLSLQEPFAGSSITSRSLGLSFGFPLARLL